MKKNNSEYFYAFGTKLPMKYWKRVYLTPLFAIFIFIAMGVIFKILDINIKNEIFFLICLIPIAFFYFFVLKFKRISKYKDIKKQKNILLLFIFLLICVSLKPVCSDLYSSEHIVIQFKNGETKQKEVIEAFDEPFCVIKDEESGEETWLYKREDFISESEETNDARKKEGFLFIFDKNKVLKNHGYLDEGTIEQFITKGKFKLQDDKIEEIPEKDKLLNRIKYREIRRN